MSAMTSLRRARAAYRGGDTSACRLHLDEGLASAERGSRAEAQLRALEARLLLWNRPALPEARAALRLAERSGAPPWEAELAVGTALALMGKPSALAHLERALASAQTSAERAETQLLTGVALHDLGRLREARARFADARRTRRSDVAALARYGEAHAAMMCDADYDFAIPALETARRGPLGLVADEARSTLAIALSDRGEDARATAVLDEREGLPLAWNRGTLLYARAEVEWAARRLRRCIAVAEEAAEEGHPVVADSSLVTRSWARLELGLDPDVPAQLSMTGPLLSHQCDEIIALQALADGKPAEARAAFLRSARRLRGVWVRNELRALLGAAYASEALGDHVGARRQRRAIEERARALGIVSICRRLEAPLEPSPRARLSRRRREVIELVAAGLPSAAIADRLGISRPTVESHIRVVLRETGARTRAEAAARLLPEAKGPRLAPEDQRIVDLLTTGATVTDAARLLHMSRRTLTRRLARIRSELGVASNAALAARRRVSD